MSSPDEPTLAEVRQQMEHAVRAYARLVDAGASGPILAPGHRVTATDVAITCGALLDSVHLEVFELALWATWGGTPWTADHHDGQDTHA